MLVSEVITDGPGCLGLRAGREIPALEDLQERRGRRVCRVPPASLANLEPREAKELRGQSDSDWAADKATRRSVSSGIVARGGHVLET